MSEKAVILISGGIDSSTTLAIAKDQGFDLYALSFRYGQRNVKEIESAKAVALTVSVCKHLIMDIDLSVIGASALTSDIPVPKHNNENEITRSVPVTYVPARNTIFLSFALSWAETLGATDIFIGVNALDYSGYPDCRPKFIRAFEKTANLATKPSIKGRKFRIHAPLIHMTKAQIIKTGSSLGIDFSLTQSCYDPARNGKACGKCDSCILRKNGFREADIPDPTDYVD